MRDYNENLTSPRCVRVDLPEGATVDEALRDGEWRDVTDEVAALRAEVTKAHADQVSVQQWADRELTALRANRDWWKAQVESSEAIIRGVKAERDELLAYIDRAKVIADKLGRVTGEPLDHFLQTYLNGTEADRG